MRRSLLVLCLLIATVATMDAQRARARRVRARPAAASGTDPLPAARQYDWANYTGVPGGIPNRTTVCASLTSSDTAATIASAISSCSAAHPSDAGGVVELAAGTYNLTGSILLKNNVSLRGAGANQTILNRSGIILTTTDTGCTTLNTSITAGGTRGTRTITVSSTTNLVVGRVMEVRRDNDAAYVYSELLGAQDVGQTNVITDVTGNVITVRNPWHVDFTGGSPVVSVYCPNYNYRIGIEDLKLAYNDTSATVEVWRCDSCWVRGVDSGHTTQYNFTFYGAVNSEFRDNYVHDGGTSSNNSGIRLYGETSFGQTAVSNVRIENNIFNLLFPAVELNGSSGGTAVLYNYVYGGNGGGTNSVSWTLDDGHGPQNMYNLYEGNIADQFGMDAYFGGAAYGVLFRSYITGYNPNFSDGGPAIWLQRLAYYYSLLGNVLGSSASNPQNYMNCGGGNSIYKTLGLPNLGNCSTTDGTGRVLTTLTYPDANVAATLFRWGNYDYFNDATRWESSEVPSGVSVPSSHYLPNSYAYTSTPSYFTSTSTTWPPIGPDVTGGTSDAVGHAHKIPAQKCWDSRTLGSGGSFSRTACYP